MMLKGSESQGNAKKPSELKLFKFGFFPFHFSQVVIMFRKLEIEIKFSFYEVVKSEKKILM